MVMTTDFSCVPRTPSAPGSRPPWPGSIITSLGLGGGTGLAIDFFLGDSAHASMSRPKAATLAKAPSISRRGSTGMDEPKFMRGSLLL